MEIINKIIIPEQRPDLFKKQCQFYKNMFNRAKEQPCYDL